MLHTHKRCKNRSLTLEKLNNAVSASMCLNFSKKMEKKSISASMNIQESCLCKKNKWITLFFVHLCYEQVRHARRWESDDTSYEAESNAAIMTLQNKGPSQSKNNVCSYKFWRSNTITHGPQGVPQLHVCDFLIGHIASPNEVEKPKVETD